MSVRHLVVDQVVVLIDNAVLCGWISYPKGIFVKKSEIFEEKFNLVLNVSKPLGNI